jgi:hypothetical protein
LSEPEKEFYRHRNGLVSLELNEFAEAIRQAQLTDDNPSTSDKEVGKIETGIIDGRQSDDFTLTRSFSHGPDGSLGYTLPRNAIYKFRFLEGKMGEKFIVRYPISDLPHLVQTAESMLSSLKWLD